MLKINDLTFRYPGRKSTDVVSDFSLTLDNGMICGLLGPNGAGKSTLFALIAGLLTPGSGSIDYDGFSPRRREAGFLSDIFLVPEEIELPDTSLDVYVAANAPFYPRFSREQMENNLARFELTPSINLGRLSMGQRKKAFISFALACNTRLLLMDEPCNGIDILGKRAFRKVIVENMTDDKTVIISTHQVHDIDRIIDHIVMIDSEKVCLNASMSEISSKLAFRFTSDGSEAASALAAVNVPGGANIVTLAGDPEAESEVDLETLFLLTRTHPELITNLFSKP